MDYTEIFRKQSLLKKVIIFWSIWNGTIVCAQSVEDYMLHRQEAYKIGAEKGIQEGIAYFKKLAQQYQNKDGQYERSLADMYHISGNSQKAMQILHQAVEKFPGNVMIYDQMITIYNDTNQFVQMKRILDLAKNKFPDHPAIYLRQADYAIYKGSYEEAVEFIIESIRKHETSQAYYMLNRIYVTLQQTRRVIIAFERGMTFSTVLTEDPRIVQAVALAYAFEAQGKKGIVLIQEYEAKNGKSALVDFEKAKTEIREMMQAQKNK